MPLPALPILLRLRILRPLFSAPDARPTFFCVAKRKSAKKRRPQVGAPLRGVPCATQVGRGLRNSGLRPSNSARPFPARPCVARRLPGAYMDARCGGCRPIRTGLAGRCRLAPGVLSRHFLHAAATPRRFFAPVPRRARQPGRRVAQGSRRSRPRNAAVQTARCAFRTGRT